MFDEQDRQYFYNEFKSNGYEVGSYDDFKKDLNNEEDRNWYYNEAKNMGYDVGTQADFDKMVLEPAPSTSGGGKQVDASATTQSVGQKASTETKPQVAQPAKKQETTDKEPGLIAKVLDMIPTGVQTSNGTYQPSPEIPQPVVKGEEMPVKEEASSSSANAAPVTTPTGVVNNEGLMDAKLANYIENWKQRPDKQSTYFENMVADLLADGTANSNEEAVNMVMPALRRYANRSAMDVTNQVVSSLPDDTVQDAEQSIGAQWYSHGVQDKLKQEADSMGISYDDYVAHFLKPAMVQSLVNKYGPNYRNIAEGIATRLYSHDENVQERLMNQDINDALSSVINKYVSPSVVDEYNKAQEEGSKAFNEGMEGSQFIPANLRLGTALGAQYEANEAKDPAKVLFGLQQKFGKLYRNPKFLNDMSNAAFKVMQRYGLNGTLSSDPKQFKPMINAAIKNELDQLEIKGMMPKWSAEYIMKTGLGNTIVGKIIRKAVQTDYQNWLEDIANQQYQPGFWENVASGALTFAGDAWSYWLPGAAGGKLTKSMVAKAEGKLAGDLMAKGMERKMAERAAKVLIGKSKAEALKSGAVHGAVTFGGQSAISKPIDEVYRTGQFDENGKIYNPSVGKVIADTLGEVAKQTAVGAIMQGGTIANMVGKGRGLATNILADIGGKVADSGIMTGHQMLERMAQDPNFKPTGKDAAESFLESMANLTAIGLPGMVGKYARFKDAREFNKKFDFTDQDIAELKRFGYDGLRDAFEKMGIGEYAVVGENAQRLDGQLTQKYMDLMNDKSVPEVLKAKMMAVVEGKRPSSFSPVVDSIIVQPMDHDGKVYLETLNKDGGIIDRKEFSSLDEAQKADKKLEYEKTLGLASVLEGEFHNEFTQEHLEGLYNKAAQKYNMGEKLTDEDKAAVYLHQNAGAIKEIMDKQQKGIILTEEEQKQINAYRHYYDSALENSSVMREFVNTFEDSHGVERGTLRKALESKDKKYAPLVESYLKELYNSIELKREMKQTMDDLYNTAHGNEQKRIEQGGVEGEKPTAPVEGSAGGQEPPVSEGFSPYQGNTDVSSVQGEGVSTANSDNSSADVITSDAFVMGQNAYKNGDSEALQAIDYNSDLATGRLKRAFADNEKMPDIVANAYNEGRDMEQFVAQRASSLTPAQKEAISKYVEAMDAKKGAIDALQHADDGYGEALKQQLWPYQTVDGNIVPATLDSGKQVFLKKANEYGGAFVVVPDEQGQPMIKQVSNAEIKEVGAPVSLDEYIENAVTQQKDARAQQFISQFDGSGLKPNDRVTVAMEEGDANIDMTFAGYSEDGKIVLTDGKDYLPLSKEEFAAWRKNALDNTINEHLDAEDDEREQKAVSQAEADKKQRYANGIVGLSEGQPDYSSKDTDAKVAAEYLQEQFGEDHGKLLNLVNGSRDDIKTQLDNKKKAAAEYRDWLDVNADLDPEKAQKVENDLALVNEQIADLDARFKNWNAIRNSVMTPDELRTMKEERKAEIERAGIDKSSVLPDVDTGVRIPENSELKDKYPTQEAASGYITSERRRVYKMQEETQREIDGVDKILNQYMDGDMELSAEQLRDLNTTKAELANRQNALTVDAKALKGKAESLNILYIKERAEQNKKNLEALSPKDRRKELVANALEKKDMKTIKEIYKDASTDVMDLTPRTLEEFVSERLFPHSLNAESLAQELGSSNFRRGIGSKYDTNKFNYLLANNGEGLTISELAKRVWEDLSGTMESGAGDGLQSTYTDQDIRNTILDMFKTYDSVRDMRNVTLLNRISAAENELSGEEEWYEQQKEREIFEKQKEIDEYKSYIHDKELSLPSESELDYINGLEFDRMMEIEDREREYKQYVKSILPELADYDDRSNEEGYGGGSSLGSDSSRRGVDDGNSQGEEVGNGEASSESEIGEGSDSGRKGRQETGSMEPGEGPAVRGSHLPQEASFGERLKSAIAETETEPTEAQKKAGNYKKGHLSFGGYDYTVETPKGVTRSGKDEQGKPWSVTMHDTYGYILGKIGVDGDHIDMFINDAADLDTFDGNVYVVDQVNPETGEFDEHKVMYGYPDEAAAITAYAKNYSPGWKGLGKVTSVPKATFDKWLESSDRKTKPFADYAIIKKDLYPNYFSDMTEEEAREKLQNDLEKLVEGKSPSEIDYGKLKSIYHSYYLRFGDDVDAAKYRKDVHAIWNKAYATHLKEISKNNAEAFVANLNPFSLKEKINIWKLSEDVDSYVDQNIAEDISNGSSLKDNFFYDDNHRDFFVSIIEKYAKYLAEKNYYLNAALQRYSKEKVPEQEKALRDALIDVIKGSGIEVVTDNKEGQKVLDSIRNVITVYHGAGASFDHFDHSFMGSGEGAQAFGWGTYVTEVPGIANEYSKASSERKLVSPQKLYFKNEEVDSASYAPWMIAYKTLEKCGKDFEKAFKVLEEKHQKYIKDVPSMTDDPDENRYTPYSAAINILKEEQKNPGSLVFEPAVFEERERNLYVLEIPKDDGDNYLDWDSPMSDIKYKELSKLLSDKKLLIPENRRGSELYNLLAKSLDSQKDASLMLSSLGFVGIKYPANYRSGGRKDGALNYVIFKEADAKIYDDYKFFRSSDGTVYGFVHDGKIYIDPSIATSEVPIHEYTHIWSRQLRSVNPKEWDNIISLMKGTTIWNEVKNSNKNLETDSDIADEVLAIYSGRKGSQRIKDEFNKIIEEDSSLLDKAKAMNAIHKVKQAINKFWKAVTDFLHVHFGSADEVADTVLMDFLNEVNPLKQKSGNEGVKSDGVLPFHRDVKEVKPSEMTEAQKVAYDAVSTMLKKAGIPVKVVSNEDMEKVAEAQDNLNLAMLLNQPEMRFKIKTPEEKQAAENAYNFAKELRPDKWKQYAVVNMSNPNKMPEYFEKQELARKERSYYNKLMWGNYKVFNLDKSFEDNVAGLTGSFPSEFDPYKIDEQTNKKNELKRQMKETEDAYNSTGQERNKYQIQLMKEYMDEHGLTSENDIPDDVWSDLNDKAHEKYQDKLDSLFAKYKDLDRQLNAVAEPGVKFLRTYHGTGAKFDKFDLSHALEGEGSETFGHGVYVTNSEKIGSEYAQRAKDKKATFGFEFVNPQSMSKQAQDMLRHYMYKHQDVAKGLENARKDLKDVIGKFPDTDYLQELNEILAKDDDSIAIPSNRAYRYDVDIPDDNGSNYLGWNESQNFPLEKWYRLWEITHNGFSENEYFNDGGARYNDDRIERILQMKLESPENGMQKLPTLKGEDLYRALEDFFNRERPSYGAELASRALNEIGFVGIKYPAGMIHGGAKEGDYNYVIFDENNVNIVGNTKLAQGKGVVYGYTDGKEIVLNQEHLNPNTPIHEYQHLWRTAAKNMNPELIEHGDKLIMQTQLFADLKQDPNYNHLTDEQICDEAFARLTGEDGAAILEQMAKDAIKENPLDTAKELSVINKLKEWLKKFWYWTLDTFTKWKPEDIKKMTLEDIRNLVLRDLANGVDPRNVKSRMTKEDAVSLRKQMADNAEQERILEHTEENWQKEFGKDSRVTTPIGSIKLGENQYKKAGRNDRIKRFGLLKPTLERPDVILEKSAPKEGAERQTKYLFIKSFKKADGNKILNYESITVKQGEEEVAISAHQIDPSKVVKELTESKVLWNRFRGDSNSLGENQGSALTPSANNPSGKDSVLNPHSDAKIRNNIETTKGNGGNLSVEDKIKAVSQQFGVDEADVAMYANAVKKGSTAEAARARANIKRHLLQANEDKISSLKELLKYTVPVNNALKENFGDLDAMIEERVKQVEAQRNAMEAARKRAEEEEAKRQKHLEELSVIPDDQLDKQYMDALAKGDDATAREMLDEAARRKGYDDTESAYQGVGAWAAPGNPGYESDKARRDDWESSGSDVNLEDMALGYTPQPDDYFSHPERYSQNTPHGLESVKAINTAIDAIKNGEKDVKVKVYRAVPTSVKEGKLRNGDWVTPSKKYAEMHGTNRLEGKYRIIEDEVPANQLWWDGNDANEFGFDDGKAYKYKNAKNNRKLNDLVTYDDKGDVIPPSKRFNSRKSDVRFMFAGEKANVKPRLGSATIGLKAAKDKVVELFHKAKSGEFNGKPQSIGTLTQEGKKFLEDLSGLKMKDKIDFVLNPSDLKHMNKDHFGDNEKDPGRNIPLTEEDLRSMVDVIMNPEQVVYGIEKMDNRKAFFFLKQAEDGTLNLAEIYSDKKGNLTAKSYYKTKKGVDQRVMEIKNSLLPTPEASSGSPLSDGKGINFFSIEQEKTAENERKIADSVVNTANKLGGAVATVYSSLDDVPEEYRSEVEQGAKGWYDPETHSVHVYLPNCEDGNDAQRTVFHEKIGHEGMEVLLGGEDGVRKFASFVYRSVGKDVRGKIIDFANKYDPDWKNPDRMNVGTQEYIAHLAEEGPKTAEDFSLWTKIKHYLIKVLKKLGVRVPGLLNDKDLRYYLMKAGKALHVWDNMPKEKQEAMMKQASNAEIKDALSDGAGKGKPRQKKGESTIQYMKRVQEWRKWQNAREDKENPEPPMFYDFDKDAEGKKEWERLNKEWRDSHHLQGDEMPIKPERKEGETDEEFFPRYKEWEKWNDAMADKENPMPDMFAFEKKKQEEVKRKYEDWLAKHDLLEQQQADLDLYEGKIYPAETNPKADALEQQVMQDLAEVTSTDVSKEGAAKTVKHAVIHRRKNMEEASADDAIYINDVKNRIEKMADSGAFDKLLSDYKGKPNRAEKLAEAIPYIIEAPRRLRDLAHDLNATDAFDKGHIHIQPDDVEAIQPFVADLIAETAKMHTVLKDDKEVKVYDDPQAVSEVANNLAQAINANHQGEEGFVPIDGTDILSKHVLPLVKQHIVPVGIDYKNLSPEMKATIDSIRDWYNYTYDWLKDNHTLREDTGYNADYVNHIWDKEKSDKQAYAMYVENRQRTKSPNEKPRTISTLMEGIGLGLVPKTTDITKMMAYYSRSNIEAWANKTMLQELSGLNVIERNEDGEIVSSDPLLSSTPPFNLEQYKYFEIPGVGPVWVYNVSPKQVTVKNPITDKENVIYSEASAGDRFGVVFDTYQSSPFWKGYDKLSSTLKKLELGFSGFHAGALTEVYMVQNMVEFGPKKAMANFMKYIFVDTMKNHQLPCFANPEDFQEAASHLVKFGATNDYAAADVQNMFDNLRDFAQKLQKKLEERGNIGTAAGAATIPFEIATQMVSMLNKGMDVALWDFLHDGLKLATYRMRSDKTKERAKKKGWTEEELSRALDEDGQFVNDMFGGQHWDILGASHRTLRYAGRVLLSPDWNASTTRHFLALTGYGSIWNEATFENFKQYYQRLWNKELIPEDEGRRSRQISALLCYGIGFMVFYEGIANGINAAFRALDEEKERKKAEEIRKTNPSYKSMYELAYGDEGMKWYDYLMRGNSLGQQSKIFLGRYADGTEMYIRHGKQFREIPEYFFNEKGEFETPGPFVNRLVGKANPLIRMGLDDYNYLSPYRASHSDKELQRKYGKLVGNESLGKTIGLLHKNALYAFPFLIPSQENKEFKAVDFFFPSSKGFSPWKAQSYFKDFILSGDLEGVVMTYQSCQRNGIDAEAQIKAAIGSVKALESAEMSDGVTSLQEASKRFDAAKSITEKKKMRQKIKKFLSQSDYKAFTQKEALDMVQGYLNGDEDLKEMEKAESKYLMKAKAEDVTEDWRIQNVWNGTMEAYQEYQRLKDVDKAKANAFKDSKTNKRLFAARKAIYAARRKMNKAKKQMDGTNDAAKLVEIRNTRKELLEKLNGME